MGEHNDKTFPLALQEVLKLSLARTAHEECFGPGTMYFLLLAILSI